MQRSFVQNDCGDNENKNDWKSLDFRQHAIASIQTAINLSGCKLHTTAGQLERRVFRKSQTLEHYFTRITKCIHYVYMSVRKEERGATSVTSSTPAARSSCEDSSRGCRSSAPTSQGSKGEGSHCSKRPSEAECTSSKSEPETGDQCSSCSSSKKQRKESQACCSTKGGEVKCNDEDRSSSSDESNGSGCSIRLDGCQLNIPKLRSVDEQMKLLLEDLVSRGRDRGVEEEDSSDENDLEWLVN